jgi:hypothetical protein
MFSRTHARWNQLNFTTASLILIIIQSYPGLHISLRTRSARLLTDDFGTHATPRLILADQARAVLSTWMGMGILQHHRRKQFLEGLLTPGSHG